MRSGMAFPRYRAIPARVWFAVLGLTTPVIAAGQAGGTGVSRVTLDSTTRLELINGRALWVDYRGRRALRLAPLEGHERDSDQEIAAVITGSEFGDGTIEIDVSGARRPGYATDDVSAYKGFVGVSFRVRGDSAERFYVRPENARLESQLFRNRSTQYEASPGYPWQALRQSNPGLYESYADIEAGAWTNLRIVVAGTTARLYVNGATEPALVVNDLKHGTSRGAIALWTRISADAYFSNLRVTAGPPVARAGLPTFAEVVNGRTERVTYRGLPAIKLVPLPAVASQDNNMMALLDGSEFRDGTIELDVAGAPRAETSAGSRGFIGLSFRTGPHGEWSEVFYLRPTNGRADDQLRRNHSVQYASDPEFPWHRLREESPGGYESYVDLEAGAWTTMRVVVSGTTARLYVNRAPQPVLVVHDVKHGDRPGRIALWAHVETDAYFGPVTVIPR